MSIKVWRFFLVWAWALCLFSAYCIATEMNPVWGHVVCGMVQLACFVIFVVIVKQETPPAARSDENGEDKK